MCWYMMLLIWYLPRPNEMVWSVAQYRMAWWWAGLLGPYFHAILTCCTVMNACQPAFCFSFAWWGHGKQTKKKNTYIIIHTHAYTYINTSVYIHIYFHAFPPLHLFPFIPLPPLVCEPFLIRVLSHLSSISKCLPPQGLSATTLTAIWPTTTSGWEGAPEAPAG